MSPRTEDQLKKKREERRGQILATALKVFSGKGYFAANISDVAASAGVSQGTIYHYFSSKEELFMAVFEIWETESLNRELGRSMEAAESAAERLRLLVAGVGRYMAESTDFFPANVEFWSHISRNDDIRRGFRVIFQRSREPVAALIRAGIDAGEIVAVDPEEIASILVSVFDGLVLQYLADPEGTDWERLSSSLIRMVFHGLMKAPGNVKSDGAAAEPGEEEV